MPCMCGDIQCWSCGPAQENFKCILCGAWADDDCEHLNEAGEYLSQFMSEIERIEKADADAYEEQYREWTERKASEA